MADDLNERSIEEIEGSSYNQSSRSRSRQAR